MVNITVQFNKPARIYYPGEEIICIWKVPIFGPTKVRSVIIKYYGEANTRIKSGKNTYSRSEVVLDLSQTVFGAEDGPAYTLQAGIHTYETRLRLPNVLPQTLKAKKYGCKGSIEYKTTLKVDIKYGFDEKLSADFYIGPYFNLNEHRYLKAPIDYTEDATFGCCCWESDPLKLVMKLPCRGFVIGETMKFHVEVNNDSDVNIISMEVKLKENISIFTNTFLGLTQSDKISRTLHRRVIENGNENLVQKQQNKIFPVEIFLHQNMEFKILQGCPNISAEYILQVTAITGGCSSNLSNTTSITIGTVPFDDIQRPLAVSLPMPSPSAPNADYASAPPPGTITEQPLPNYTDAVYNPAAMSVMIPVPESEANEETTSPPTYEEIQKLLPPPSTFEQI